MIGVSSLGGKAESGAVVNRIGDILGRDSPAFSAIRQEVIFDVVQPLLQPEPNLKGFVRNYDNFVKKNGTLLEALIPESLEPLADLRQVADSTQANRSAGFQANLVRSLTRITFGHELARGAARLGLIEQAISQVIRIATPTGKKNFINEVLGFDPNQRVLPIAPPAAIAGFQAAGREEELQENVN